MSRIWYVVAAFNAAGAALNAAILITLPWQPSLFGNVLALVVCVGAALYIGKSTWVTRHDPDWWRK